MNLKGRNFLTLKDFTPDEILYMIDLAADLKDKKKKGVVMTDKYAGKNIALIFEKTSTRTRCSFEVAAHDLGMGTTYLDPSGSQIGKKESIADTARVLGRMFDGIEYRGYGQEIVEELAKYAGVPVWNGLTNEYHPTQMLADVLTIREKLGRIKGVNLTYMGDARYNMGNSLMIVSAKLGMNFTACTSKDYFPDEALVNECREIAKETGATITLTEDVKAGTAGADVIYTDVWVSRQKYGQKGSRNFLLIRSTKPLWIMRAARRYLCTAFRLSMISRPRSARTYMSNSVCRNLRLPMKYLNRNSRSYLTKQRTECTQLRQ